MNYLEKLKRIFRKRKKQPSANGNPNSEKTSKVLLKLEHLVLYPHDLMESFGCAIALDTLKPAMLSVRNIQLYKLYSPNGNKFIGSCYAFLQDGKYYGNIIGSDEVFVCRKDAYRFVKTEVLYAPLRYTGNITFVLLCRYDEKNEKLQPLQLKQMQNSDNSEKILHTFPVDSRICVTDAMVICRNILKENF